MNKYDEIVNKRLEEGWKWDKLPEDGSCWLSPPNDFFLKNACAMWIEYKPGYRIPHWIDRNENE